MTTTTKKDPTFRNILLLILITLGIRGWFEYFPHHANSSLQNAHIWLTNKTEHAIEMIEDRTQGDILMTDNTQTISITPEISIDEPVPTTTPTNENTENTQDSNINIVDTDIIPQETEATEDTITITSDDQTITNQTSISRSTANTVTITIGGKQFSIDGAMDEDIIIYYQGYTISIK